VDDAMSAAPRLIDLPVDGGDLRVAIWEPVSVVERTEGETKRAAPTALLVHGVTSSHLAWSFVADELPEVRLIAPDLRGRGGSRDVGPAGMARHAADLAAVLDGLGIERTLVVGHSMGAFVSVVFAQLYPERVSDLILIDGGLPLDVPAGLTPDEMVSHILGPTAARLSMRFGDVDEYLDLWRAHPAFVHDWSPQLEEYLAYDLVPDGAGALQPATAYETVVDDTVDMNTTTVVTDALAALRHPVRFVSVPRGLQDEPPGLYAADRLPGLLAQYPSVSADRWDGFNHYTVVMSGAGAGRVAPLIRATLGD
jgi:pimeloyl-ACP methyl ester carboxylesterase